MELQLTIVLNLDKVQFVVGNQMLQMLRKLQHVLESERAVPFGIPIVDAQADNGMQPVSFSEF